MVIKAKQKIILRFNLSLVVLCLACVTLSGVSPSVCRGELVAAKAPHVVDVAIAADGQLHGRLIGRNNEPLVAGPVRLLRGKELHGESTSDEEGRFALPIARGGYYVVCVGNSESTLFFTPVRAWGSSSAPPHAAEAIEVRYNQTIVRGQWGPPPRLNRFVHASTRAMANPWIASTVVATAVGVPVLVHNIDQDNDGS